MQRESTVVRSVAYLDLLSGVCVNYIIGLTNSQLFLSTAICCE